MDLNQDSSLPNFKEEFTCRVCILTGDDPQKFATTKWTEGQHFYLLYRSVLAVYSLSVLMWQCYQASRLPTSFETEAWFMSFPFWTFSVFALYHCVALLLAALNFLPDCLCNDDLTWYHRLSWGLCTVAYDSCVLCSLSTILHNIGQSTGSDLLVEYATVFASVEVNFYIVSTVVITIDVFLSALEVRFLHFVYASLFVMLFYAFHFYRWVAGYGAIYQALDVGTKSSGAIAGYVIITVFILTPSIHLTGFGISRLKLKSQAIIKARERRRIFLLNTRTNLLTFDEETDFFGPSISPAASSSGYFSSDFLNSHRSSQVYWTNRIHPRNPPIYED